MGCSEISRNYIDERRRHHTLIQLEPLISSEDASLALERSDTPAFVGTNLSDVCDATVLSSCFHKSSWSFVKRIFEQHVGSEDWIELIIPFVGRIAWIDRKPQVSDILLSGCLMVIRLVNLIVTVLFNLAELEDGIVYVSRR